MPPSLTGLATGEELRSIYGDRSKTVDEKTITAGSDESLALKLLAEEKDGWRVLKKNRRSYRLAKDKPTDRQLEDDVWSLLYRMDFRELNAVRHFSIQAGLGTEPRQIDVFAKDDQTVFIVECTHSREPGPKSVKALLDKIAGFREDIIKAVHTHYGREPRLKVKFAIATRNIDWRSADVKQAEASGIPIILDDDLQYFNKLTDLLKSAARYQFLGRYFSGEKIEGLRTRLPATKGFSGGKVFYNFLISPHDLLRVSYISHRRKGANDDLGTYQRMVKPARLKAIGKYIDEGGKFPTNIVLNFKVDGHLNFDKKESFGDTATGILHLPGQYGSAWVIDGQHRLFGYAHAERLNEDRSVVTVLAYENLPVNEEVKLFVDINTEQVKVSRNLVNEILSSLDIEDPDPRKRLDAAYARIALKLDAYSTSPLRNRVQTVSQDKTFERCITLTSLTDGIAANNLLGTLHRAGRTSTPNLHPGLLTDSSDTLAISIERAVVTLSRYLALFSTRLEEHWKLGDARGGYLCTNNGLRALLQLFRRVLQFVVYKENLLERTMEPEEIVEKVEPYIEPVISFFHRASTSDVGHFRNRGSSLQSVDQNCNQMMAIINETLPEFTTPELADYMNSRDIEGTKEAKEMIDTINDIVFRDVIAALQAHYGLAKDAWWLRGVPNGIRNSCDQQYNANTGDHERWRYLYFINYYEIILHAQNWELFKEHYNFYGKGKKADLIRWIPHVNKARTVTHHAEKGPLSKTEVEYVRVIHQLVKTYIDGRERTVTGKRLIDDDETPDATTSTNLVVP